MRHKETPSFFILAGEPSGDIHGEKLVKALKKIYYCPTFKGVAGPLMREEGVISLFPMEEFSVMGFQEIIAKIPFYIKKLFSLKNRIIDEKFDACILIDFPDFNLLLARLLRRCGYQGKIIQMIPPTVWAWRKGRIKTLEKHFDLILSIFPFEEEIYKNTPIKFAYIGNPIFEEVKNHNPNPRFREILNIKKDSQIISLFPGSRKTELQKNLPKQLQVLQALKKELRAFSIAISLSSDDFRDQIQEIIDQYGFKNRVTVVPADKRYDLMRESSLAITKSGTVTLELALHRCPFVVTYEVSRLNYWIAKYAIRLKVPYFSIANILLNEETFPEHIVDCAPVEAVSESVKSLLFCEVRRSQIFEKQIKIYNMLSNVDPDMAIENAMKGLLK